MKIATTPIYLPTKLVEQARDKLEFGREIELETFLAIYLRLILRDKGTLGLADTLPFGKYVGEVVENICRADPSYIGWLIAQNGRTKFKSEVSVLIDKILTEKDAAA